MPHTNVWGIEFGIAILWVCAIIFHSAKGGGRNEADL